MGLPDSWSPFSDTCIPEGHRLPAFAQWVTSYFAHDDLSCRDPKALSQFVPATFRIPTIFNMTKEETSRIVSSGTEANIDIALKNNIAPQLLTSFRKACFDGETRRMFPNLKVVLIAGDASPSLGPAAFYALKDEDQARGGGWIDCRLIPGFNHVVSAALLV